MRFFPVVLATLVVGCSSGGESLPPLPIQMVVGLDLVRADAPTTRAVAIENPLDEDATVALVGEATGPIRPAVGALPDLTTAGASYSLAVLVTPDGSQELAEELTVRFTGTTSGFAQDVLLLLSASVEATTVVLATPAVDFGNVLLGSSSTRSVRVRNPNQLTPVRVTGVSAPPAEFELLPVGLPATLQPGQQLTLTLDYTPTGLGTKDFSLSISHSEATVPLQAAIAAETTTWVPEIVTEFGAVTVAAGETEWLEVSVPAHAISLSIEAIGPDSATVGLLGLEGPDGTIYENDQATGAFLWSPGQGVFTATVPNSDRGDVQLVSGGGTYRFRLYLFSGFASTLSIRTIVHNRLAGFVVDGLLHLNVYLAEGLNITSPSGSTRLQGILAEADRIFCEAGPAPRLDQLLPVGRQRLRRGDRIGVRRPPGGVECRAGSPPQPLLRRDRARRRRPRCRRARSGPPAQRIARVGRHGRLRLRLGDDRGLRHRPRGRPLPGPLPHGRVDRRP